MSAEWIVRLVEDERKRDAVRASALAVATRRASVVNTAGRRLFEELRYAVVHDVETFRREFAGDDARALVIGGEGDGGFEVSKPGFPSASLKVLPRFEAAVVGCRYRFRPDDRIPVREDHMQLVFAQHGEDGLQLKRQDSGEVFLNAGALSEFLLTPIFTGRPR